MAEGVSARLRLPHAYRTRLLTGSEPAWRRARAKSTRLGSARARALAVRAAAFSMAFSVALLGIMAIVRSDSASLEQSVAIIDDVVTTEPPERVAVAEASALQPPTAAVLSSQKGDPGGGACETESLSQVAVPEQDLEITPAAELAQMASSPRRRAAQSAPAALQAACAVHLLPSPQQQAVTLTEPERSPAIEGHAASQPEAQPREPRAGLGWEVVLGAVVGALLGYALALLLPLAQLSMLLSKRARLLDEREASLTLRERKIILREIEVDDRSHETILACGQWEQHARICEQERQAVLRQLDLVREHAQVLQDELYSPYKSGACAAEDSEEEADEEGSGPSPMRPIAQLLGSPLPRGHEPHLPCVTPATKPSGLRHISPPPACEDQVSSPPGSAALDCMADQQADQHAHGRAQRHTSPSSDALLRATPELPAGSFVPIAPPSSGHGCGVHSGEQGDELSVQGGSVEQIAFSSPAFGPHGRSCSATGQPISARTAVRSSSNGGLKSELSCSGSSPTDSCVSTPSICSPYPPGDESHRVLFGIEHEESVKFAGARRLQPQG